MNIHLLRTDPPDCPTDLEAEIAANWREFASDPNRLLAVCVGSYSETNELRMLALLFDERKVELTIWKPPTLQIVTLVIARH